MNGKKTGILGLLAVAGAVALAQTAYTFTVNGKGVKLETVERGGRAYVDAEAFAKALGASVTYDKAKRSYVIVSSGQNAIGDVQGTTQLAGGEGALGKSYSLGKGENALNFTLKGAEFSVTRVTVGSYVYAPKAAEKLLVLRYTVQNPQKRDMPLSWSSFKITAVDAKDVNHVFNNYIAREGTSESLGVSLKPAQKIDAYLALTVPADSVIPKLIVERGDSSPVLRYDLRKAKGLPAPYADPADASGAIARAEVPAELGKAYPGKTFDIKLDSVAYSTESFEKRPAGEGKRYLVATFTIKNATAKTASDAPYSYSSFTFELRDADGDKTKFGGYLIKASRDETASGSLKPGEEARFRVFFALPQDLAGKTLYASENDSRAYAFDVSSAK